MDAVVKHLDPDLRQQRSVIGFWQTPHNSERGYGDLTAIGAGGAAMA
jgi:hypothetical protein